LPEIAISKVSVKDLVEFTALIRDITVQIRLMDVLQRQAATGELTGIYEPTLEPSTGTGSWRRTAKSLPWAAPKPCPWVR